MAILWILGVFVFLNLLALIYLDLKARRLPNFLLFIYLLSGVLLFIAFDYSLSILFFNTAIAVIAFAITVLFYALRWMGGGDVKLWSVLMFWAGFEYAWPAIIIATLVGGIMAVLGLFARWRAKTSNSLLRPLWRALSADRGVPYGVGLSLAGIFVLYMRSQPYLGTI